MNKLKDTLPLAAAIVLTGCATTNPVNTRLDSSGHTVVTLDDAIVLARSAPRLTMSARDYVYLGPVEINRMGQRRQYIWVGMASTVDRTLAMQPAPQPAAMTLLVDDVPMYFTLKPWEFSLDRAPYESVVPVQGAFAAEVSVSQLSRIADAATVEVFLSSADGTFADFRHWNGEWPWWSAFDPQRQFGLKTHANLTE